MKTNSRLSSNHKSSLLFIGLLVVLFFAYRYPYSTRMGPYSIHNWRQSSGLSIALNYEKEAIGFFEPTINWTGDGTSGKTVVEFPILYYLVGKIWKLVGHREFIPRLLSLLIVYTGLFYLFRLLREFLRDDFWAILIPLLLFTSPALVYYANNSMMDAPSFGLVLIGAYYYWRYVSSARSGPLYFSMFIFLLAGLLKLSSIILFTALFLMQLLAKIGYLQKRLNFKNIYRSIQLVPFAVVILVLVAWNLWAKAYNDQHIGGVFLQGLNPIWKTGLYDGLYTGTLFYTNLLGALFDVPAFYLFLLLFLWLLFNYRKSDLFLFSLTMLTLGGSLLFFLFFFRALGVNDYYVVNLLIMVPLILLTFVHYLKNNYPALFRDRGMRSIAVIGLILMTYSTMVRQRAKYDTGDTFVKHTIILDLSKKETYRQLQEEYRNRFQALETIEPYLRNLGIRREEKVISIPDDMPNYTLYLMDQKGITDYGYGNLQDDDRIEHFISTGARYLIINDTTILNKAYLQPYIRHPIGEYMNVMIYRLNNLPDVTDRE